MKAKVLVLKKDCRYFRHILTAHTPKQEQKFNDVPDGTEIVLSVEGSGEYSPAQHDFIDELNDQLTTEARNLGIMKVHGLYDDTSTAWHDDAH